MKKILLSVSLITMAFVSFSCAKEIDTFDNNGDVPAKVFRAELTDSKTLLTPADKVEWTTTDEVSINGVIYTVIPDAGDATKSTLTKKNAADAEPSAPYTAIYPATLANGTKYVLPDVQMYFSLNDISAVSPMRAYSETTTLGFKNICALLELQLTGETTLKRIYIKDSSKGLSGEFTVTDNTAVVTGTTGVTLNCKEVGDLTSESKNFYVSIPAGTYAGLKFYFSDIDDNIIIKSVEESKTVARNTIYEIPANLDFTTCEHRGVQLWNDGPFWSKCNLGASEEFEYGDYFSWGETAPRYTKLTFKGPENGVYTIEEISVTNANTYAKTHGAFQTSGTYDTQYEGIDVKAGSTVLVNKDDAAFKIWGGGWTMPRHSRFSTMLSSCYFQSKLNPPYFNDVAGYLVFRRHSDDSSTTWNTTNSSVEYSVENDDYIFLPATGYINGRALTAAGTAYYYMSKTLGAAASGNFSRMYCLLLAATGANSDQLKYQYRYYGCSIRPIIDI